MMSEARRGKRILAIVSIDLICASQGQIEANRSLLLFHIVLSNTIGWI